MCDSKGRVRGWKVKQHEGGAESAGRARNKRECVAVAGDEGVAIV